MKKLASLVLLLAMAFPCAAESGGGTSSATANIKFTVEVSPVFKVLRTTPAVDGYEYRIWTNIKSVVIDGKEYRFNGVGEAIVFIPSSKGGFIVHGL
ncbi:hypothetical protein C7T35_10200 [Variovorax sp. WS11]|uniref:hypothetical protein n=1 Tax=Variovorax sp. WS11 TaxID=1105204 RepID=UPI000D0D5F7B|nr:hypothetical protein [Variovorax sp. WS11]NDZ12722.1 hypothetical protein [Variovorax sp. WS11]PSL84663.1 hypothetical protein C7T35_10200 [Variovorax sp. WS11]